MKDPLIRRAEETDATAISSTLLNAFEEYRSQYTQAGFAATTPTPEQILQRLSEGLIWVALLNDEIVGTVSAVRRNSETLYLRGMAVLPGARGLLVGSLLFEEVRCYAIQQNHTRLLLSTTPFLHRAIKLYERLGFVRTDEGPTELHGTPLFSMAMQV
jgi:GNAT superfamily N-acetyltransferase